MPHVIVEYSANLEPRADIAGLVDGLHSATYATGLFELPAIRVRAAPRAVYRVADGNPANAFVHAIARIRQGRTLEQRQGLGRALLAATETALAGILAETPIGITIEVIEMDETTLFRKSTLKA